MSEKRTEIGELGEFGLINRITSSFVSKNSSTHLAVGDDAAIIQPDAKSQILVSTDMLMEGIHFDLSYVPLPHLGYKAVAVNVSDIAAMNGVPEQITVSIGISNRFSVEAVEALYEGVRSACEHFGVDLIGGDTCSSGAGLVISVTVIGKAPKDLIATRSGAKKNDIICATGDLGAAYMGLQVLSREKEAFKADPEMQPQIEDYKYLVERQLKPQARMDIIHELRELKIVPTSMIDISDGLSSELFHLGKSSGVGAHIFEDKLPIDHVTYKSAVEFGIDPITCALNGGEDYELLFTISQEDFEKVKNHDDIHFIGYATEAKEGFHLITKQGNQVPLQAQGWVSV